LTIKKKFLEDHTKENDDTLRSLGDPSEADESEGSMIIHDSLDESITNQYDQATQMINKTLDSIKSVNLKESKSASTISEVDAEHETLPDKISNVSNLNSALQKSLELHREYMECSMTESMEECSAAESARGMENYGVTENPEAESDNVPKQEASVSVLQSPELKDKSDGENAPSSISSPTFFSAEVTSDSHSGSRPSSSDVEALISGTTGTSEYETALSSQGNTHKSQRTSISDYRTANTSMSSKDSISIESESSGNLGSIELSEASETIVPSSLELERDMDVLDQEIYEEEMRKNSQCIIPQLTVQSETPNREDSPIGFEVDSDEMDESNKVEKEGESHIPSKMKRSIEMTFPPEPETVLNYGNVECVSEQSSENKISEVQDSPMAHSNENTGTGISVAPQGSDVTFDEVNAPVVKPVVTSCSSISSVKEEKFTSSTVSSRPVDAITKTDSQSNNSVFQLRGSSEDVPATECSSDVDSWPVVEPKYEGISADPSEGPFIATENQETEVDQEFGRMMSEDSIDIVSTELTYDDNDDVLKVDEPNDRPKTPEPGNAPRSIMSQMSVTSLVEADDMTEVDQRFSEIFSMTFEDRDEYNLIPDIKITEHDNEIEEDYVNVQDNEFDQCIDINESESSSVPEVLHGADISQPLKSNIEEETHQNDSFELVGMDDVNSSENEETMSQYNENFRDISEVGDGAGKPYRSIGVIDIPQTIKAIKIESDTGRSCENDQDETKLYEESDPSIDKQRRWLEMQFEESLENDEQLYETKLTDHVFAGPLEDILEEREDNERRDLFNIQKSPSSISTPDYDVLAGKKFFTRSGEHDDISISSLQEFERYEREIALESAARRSRSGSQESLNGKRQKCKSSDAVSVSSLDSLNEFEILEKQCQSVEALERKAMEEHAILSEIEEGHESQVSDVESDEDSEAIGECTDKIFQIEEIIRQAQDNVEKFESVSNQDYKGISLKDIASIDSSPASVKNLPITEISDGCNLLDEAASPENIYVSRDSLDRQHKHHTLTDSIDSLDTNDCKDIMKTSIDSLEQPKKDIMTVSADSIEPLRQDMMITSLDSLGKDDSSGRDADVSCASDVMTRANVGGVMDWSTDSLEPSSSFATHATYHDNDSLMSSSIASGYSNTLVGSLDDSNDFMTTSMYIPEGELPKEEMYEDQILSGKKLEENVKSHLPSSEENFSRTITRKVVLPPEIREVKFAGSDVEKRIADFKNQFEEGHYSSEEKVVDEKGSVHIQKVVQKRIIIDPEETRDFGFDLSDPSVEEKVIEDDSGNRTTVIKRTIVSVETTKQVQKSFTVQDVGASDDDVISTRNEGGELSTKSTGF